MAASVAFAPCLIDGFTDCFVFREIYDLLIFYEVCLLLLQEYERVRSMVIGVYCLTDDSQPQRGGWAMFSKVSTLC